MFTGLGVARIPRGPRPQTRDNAAGLTERQHEVVGLLAQGLSNAEIAQRLVVSVRTVDHHVAAELGKLGVTSRRDAARRAAELGLPVPPTRHHCTATRSPGWINGPSVHAAWTDGPFIGVRLGS